jgi:hypothetical protein
MGTTRQAPRQRSSTRSGRNGVVSKTSWAGLAVHTITLPSGARVKARFPNIELLLAGDAVPDELRETAMSKVLEKLRVAIGQPAAEEDEATVTPEALRRLDDYQRFLVSRALVEPKLSYEDLAEGSPFRPPEEDVWMLMEIFARERNLDAVGVMLGIEPLDRWATFRDQHGCGEGCEACAQVINAFSSVDVGAV